MLEMIGVPAPACKTPGPLASGCKYLAYSAALCALFVKAWGLRAQAGTKRPSGAAVLHTEV